MTHSSVGFSPIWECLALELRGAGQILQFHMSSSTTERDSPFRGVPLILQPSKKMLERVEFS